MSDGNLIFNKGACIGIIGESGSGKTELLKTISGTQDMIPGIVGGSVKYFLNEEQEYSVYFKKNGKYYLNKNHHEVKRDFIGFIPQDPKSYLNPYWTIRKIFKESYKIKSRDVEFEQFLSNYLNQVDIDYNKYQNKYPHQLSGGESQRVMVALVLSKEPSLIIADESTTGLDVTRQKTIIDTFKKIFLIPLLHLSNTWVQHDDTMGCWIGAIKASCLKVKLCSSIFGHITLLQCV